MQSETFWNQGRRAMNEHTRSPKIPIGAEFLDLLRQQERICEASFDSWLPHAGKKAPQTTEALGTVLSYLDRIASCWWGCDGGDHQQERLVGRAASNARATLLLLRAGYYDEALGVVRQIGELANLLWLFMNSDESFLEWRSANEKVRRRSFSAVRVRERLEGIGVLMPMDETLYGRLSGMSIHANPETTPQSHSVLAIPTMGAYFQEVGALVVLNHLASLAGFALWFGSTLLQQPADQVIALKAARRLVESIGGIDIETAGEYREHVRGTTEFKELEMEMWQVQEERKREFAKHNTFSETDAATMGGNT